MYKHYYIVLLFIIVNTCFSQNSFAPNKYQLESGLYLSTSGQTPFWLRSNQYGIVPIESQIATIRGSAYKEYDSTKKQNQIVKKLDIGYGLGLVVNVGKKNNILLPEAYVKMRFGAFEIYGGRKKEIMGLVDSTLTTGSYIWSGNALPMPKVQISIPNYVSILGNGLLSVKGGYAHGWFNNGYVKNYYLHQKWIYARLGKPHWKVKFYGGVNHQVQWGGKPSEPYIEPQTGQLITKLPSNLATYFKVISGVSLNTSDNGTNTGIPLNEAWNRAGNHLGTIDVASEISFNRFKVMFYRQSIYEDGSLFFLNNINDGLMGISIEQNSFKLNFEYLNTTNQGGETGSKNTIPQLRGRDDYFNNTVYLNGWTYNGNVIGSPLINSIGQVNKHIVDKENIILVNAPNSFIVNNRVRMYTIALYKEHKKFNFTSRLMWSNNLGLYGVPLAIKQFSLLQQFVYRISKYELHSKLAVDFGELYKNNLGGYFGVRCFI